MENIWNKNKIKFIIFAGYLENLKQLSVKCDVLFVMRIDKFLCFVGVGWGGGGGGIW